jgi:hypothetical protein
MTPVGLRRWVLRLLLLLLPITPWAAAAQAGPAGMVGDVFVNSELERYLRHLQLIGRVPAHPWSVRGFSVGEIEALLPRDPSHLWFDRYGVHDGTPVSGLVVVSPRIATIFNSSFPDGASRGAIWAGRGVTLAAQGGFLLRQGPLTVRVAPTAFWSQNGDFRLKENGRADESRFADGYHPNEIDRPQRFGDDPYARIDAGQSEVRIDGFGASIGISSANQHWGPAVHYPLVLGDNAPGFPHVSVGSSGPVDLGFASVHAKSIWGVLHQSEFSPMGSDGDRRVMAGLVGAVTLRWLPGLEIGGGRFFHLPWPDDGLSRAHLLKPFESLLKSSLTETGVGPDGRSDPDNQIASAFARWIFPSSRFEVYGEFAREDHNIDFRDLMLQPDHNSAYLLGFARAWSRGERGWVTFRGEIANARRTHLERVRWQSTFYVHSEQTQGHTHRGQILGAPAVYGGGGTTLSVDYHHAKGRVSLIAERTVRHAPAPFSDGEPTGADDVDVLWGTGVESLVFRSRFDLLFGLGVSHDLNREGGGDTFNVTGQLRLQARL